MNQKQEQTKRYILQDVNQCCNPDIYSPFLSIEDAVDRLLPYHVFAHEDIDSSIRLLEGATTQICASRDFIQQKNTSDMLLQLSKDTATLHEGIIELEKQVSGPGAAWRDSSLLEEFLINQGMQSDIDMMKEGMDTIVPVLTKKIAGEDSGEETKGEGQADKGDEVSGEAAEKVEEVEKQEEQVTTVLEDHKKIQFGFSFGKKG